MIAIVGGGIVGYCTAYYLTKKGHRVTIIEKSSDERSPSYWNAGMVVPSHFIPLAAPGVIAKGIKWMFSNSSPFYIKPRFDKDLFTWLYHFYRHANSEHVQSSAPVLRDLNQRSRTLFDSIVSDTNQHQEISSGLLMVFNTEKGKREELEIASLANNLGVEAQSMTQEELAELDGGIEYACKGAVYYPGDAFLSPKLMMQQLESYLTREGVLIKKSTEVQDFEISDGRISGLKTSNGCIETDEVVLTAGVFSSTLAEKLKLRLPMQGGKGYSITIDNPEHLPSICSILTEAKVAVTPMNGALRLAGTMEITGTDMRIRAARVRGYLQSVEKYMPQFPYDSLKTAEVWTGLRPCTPDGLPYIGRSSQYKNLVINTGHAMMGFSLGPVSGLLAAQLCTEEQVELNIDRLNPERYS